MHVFRQSSKTLLPWFLCACFPVVGQVNVLQNGSFESGLTGWTQATQLNSSQAGIPPGAGTCIYAAQNPATDFAATQGGAILRGSVTSTSGNDGIINCVSYQDVAIPANAMRASFHFDAGIMGSPGSQNARVGLYPNTSTPDFTEGAIGGSSPAVGSNADTMLRHFDANNVNISSVAGHTVRFAILNAADFTGTNVLGVDNVQLFIGPSITSVSPSSGPSSGGNTVTITGSGFTGATSVTFAGASAASFTVVSDTSITAVVPAGSLGTASVIVTTPQGPNGANTFYSLVVVTPTLGEWGMIALTLLLILYSVYQIHRRNRPLAERI